MGKKNKPKPVDPPIIDQAVSLDPGDDGIMETDAHVEGHGTHD